MFKQQQLQKQLFLPSPSNFQTKYNETLVLISNTFDLFKLFMGYLLKKRKRKWDSVSIKVFDPLKLKEILKG